MLNRTTVSTPLPRVAWGALRQRLLAGPNALLLQSVLIALLASLLACAYLWQSNAISDIEGDTLAIRHKTESLERSNAELMVQLAKWNHPGYIEQAARKQGMVPARPAMVVQIPKQTAPAQNSFPIADDLMALWRRLVNRRPAAAAVWPVLIGAR